MPERGDMMRLHFPTKDESEHYIICSDNGNFDKLFSCLNASKGGKEPQKVSGPPLSNSNAPYEKYLTTPEGKGMLLNDGVVKYHTTGDISTIQMEDGKGIVISSEGNIEMLANNIVTSSTKQIHMTAGKKIEMISGGSSVIIDGEGNRIDKKAGDIYLESPLNKEMKILTEDEASQILSEAGYSREKTVIGYTPDGIPITPENKFDDAIYNYLYAYWKEHSGEYDPKKDVIPESEMNKMHPKTKNEFQFEQWLFEQYGMTSKEKTENTLMGNLNVLLEVSDVIDIAALPVGAIAAGAKLVGKKVIKEVGEKAVKEVAEEAVEKTVKTEVSEEVAENAAKKELSDTAKDLTEKIVKKEEALEDSSIIKVEIDSIYLNKPSQGGVLNIGAGTNPIRGAYNIDINPVVEGVYLGDVNNLSNIITGSQKKIIMQNPYNYDPLSSEINRILEKEGMLNITGGMSNKWFNKVYKMTPEQLNNMGYKIVYKGEAINASQGMTTSGEVIKSKIMEIVLQKK